jgi:hypothetical protein
MSPSKRGGLHWKVQLLSEDSEQDVDHDNEQDRKQQGRRKLNRQCATAALDPNITRPSIGRQAKLASKLDPRPQLNEDDAHSQ